MDFHSQCLDKIQAQSSCCNAAVGQASLGAPLPTIEPGFCEQRRQSPSTVTEHFETQIKRHLDAIEQLRDKQRQLEAQGLGKMDIEAFGRRFSLWPDAPF